MSEFFTLRLNKVRILDNREWLNAAEVKIISFVTPGNQGLPMLDDYQNTNDNAERRALIKTAAEGIVSSRVFTEVQNVKDDTTLTFGGAGVSLYTAYQIPIDLNWSLTLIEIDTDVREIGERLTGLVESEDFDNFTDEIISTVGAEANPGLKIAFKVSKFFTQAVGRSLAENKDDQIGMYIESLNRFEHYRYGERKRDAQRGVNGNIFVDYTIFGVANLDWKNVSSGAETEESA